MKSLRSMLTMLSILLFAVMVTAGSVAAGDEEDCYKDAQLAYLEGDYETAVELFTCAVDEDPENYAAYLGRGEARLLSVPPLTNDVFFDYSTVIFSDPDLAYGTMEDYNRQIEADPESIESRILRLFLSWYYGDFETVIADAEAIIELDEDNSLAYLLRGLMNQSYGITEDVEEDFERAIELDPENPVVYDLIAYSYYASSDFENAIIYFTGLIELEPDNVDALYQRGVSYASLGDYEAAIDDYTQVIELNPDFTDAYYSRGLARNTLGDYEGAVEDFTTVIEATGGDAGSFQARGTALLSLGEESAGAEDYLTYIELIGYDIRDTEKIETGAVVEIDMSYGVVYYFEFRAQEGDVLTILAESPDDVDALIVLLDPDGEPLTGNDDRDGANLDYNAEIVDFEAPATGWYTLIVSHAYANPYGVVEVSVEIGE